MIKVIKAGISEEAAAEFEANVKATVEGILADIGARGDEAVRELSEKFDKWSPESFRIALAAWAAASSAASQSDQLLTGYSAGIGSLVVGLKA